MSKFEPKDLNLKVGDRVLLQNGEQTEVDRVDINDPVLPYRIKNYGWYSSRGAHANSCNIVTKLPPNESKSSNSNNTVSFTLTLTNKEVELMRNCLSDLVECGQSLNLKLVNALIDAGYRK